MIRNRSAGLVASIGMLWEALGSSGKLWDALGSSGMLWDALGCSGMLWDAQRLLKKRQRGRGREKEQLAVLCQEFMSPTTSSKNHQFHFEPALLIYISGKLWLRAFLISY